MKYNSSTPMPDVNLLNEPGWNSVPVSCLNSNIQETLKSWNHNSDFVMMKSELFSVTLCINTRGIQCTLLHFQ